jgi:hypothetical protein
VGHLRSQERKVPLPRRLAFTSPGETMGRTGVVALTPGEEWCTTRRAPLPKIRKNVSQALRRLSRWAVWREPAQDGVTNRLSRKPVGRTRTDHDEPHTNCCHNRHTTVPLVCRTGFRRLHLPPPITSADTHSEPKPEQLLLRPAWGKHSWKRLESSPPLCPPNFCPHPAQLLRPHSQRQQEGSAVPRTGRA